MSETLDLRRLAVDDVAVSLGEEIKKARERKKLTQPELAALLDVSESTVSNWERDATVPKSRLAMLRDVLDLDHQAAPSVGALTDAVLFARVAEVHSELAHRLARLGAENERLRQAPQGAVAEVAELRAELDAAHARLEQLQAHRPGRVEDAPDRDGRVGESADADAVNPAG